MISDSNKGRFFFIFLVLLGSILPFLGFSTHIVGGEVYYRYLGNDQFEITLKVYRDCFNGQAAFDNPASIAIYNGSGQLVANDDVSISNQFQVPAVIINPCLIPPTNLCYEVAEYVYTRTLSAVGTSYTIAYQRCCRNQTIINLSNVQSTGGTYTATIPPPQLAFGNSNPVFNSLPPTFICQGDPFVFDHSATDINGDSLVYELCTPLSGGSRQIPAPDPADPPPYQPVVFLPPYSLGNMLGGIPFTIDTRTGIVTATPNSAGQFVYGVCVKEYRNGILIGDTRRDFQLNVVPCPSITVASIFSPNILCGTLDASFQNSSYGASTYRWDFGDPSVSTDTSSQAQPTYSYPDTGTYQVRLIAYSSYNINCNDTVVGEARVYPSFTADFSIGNTRCSPVFTFSDGSYGASGSAQSWRWNFGDGTGASAPNIQHTYYNPGSYPVTLIASADSGCTDTLTRTIDVLPLPVADFSLSIDSCLFTLQAENASANASAFEWSIDGQASSNEFEPSLLVTSPGNHQVSLAAVSDSGCTDRKDVTINLPESPQASFGWQVDPCDSTVRFSNNSTFSSGYSWYFGDSSSSTLNDPQHTYAIAGEIPVLLIAKSSYGCADSALQNIFFVSYKEAAFVPEQDSCSSFIGFSGVTDNAVSYRWEFGDGSFSTEKSPRHRYTVDGTYSVKLVLNGEYNCVDSILKVVEYETPRGERVYIPNTFTPNGDGLNDRFRISMYNPCYNYSLRIFNRWGHQIYEIDDASSTDWDGFFEGRVAPSGIYTWLLEGGPETRTGLIQVAY